MLQQAMPMNSLWLETLWVSWSIGEFTYSRIDLTLN
jgi:hypothetical protein